MFSSYNPPTISSIYIEGLEISAKDAEAAAIAARDEAQAARDDALQYRNETHTYYTQVQQIQTGDYVTTQSLNDALSAFSFSDLASVPTSFTPSAHTHSWGDISGKPSAFTPAYHTHLWAHITDKPTEFEPAEHVHTWQQIAQKPGTFPPESHYHNWADIEGKPSAFNPSAHTHSWGDISGKPTKFEPVMHAHDWSAIDNKPLAFPPESHTHHWDTVTNKPAQATRWPTFTEVTGKPAQATRWPKYSEVTEKPVLGSASARDVGVSTGQLMEVGAGGLLADVAPNITDWDTALDSGFYKSTSVAGHVNTPDDSKSGWYGIVTRLNSQNVHQQLTLATAHSPRTFVRTYQVSKWTEWSELYHSGNAANPLDFGVGAVKALPLGTSLKAAEIENGKYYIQSASDAPNNHTGSWHIDVKKTDNPNYKTIEAWGVGKITGRYRKYIATLENGKWSEWVELFTSANADFETFGGGDSNEKIVSGYARFSNYAVFEPKLSFVKSARNIEVSGTFKIIDKVEGNTIIDGINGLSLSGESSNKEGVIVFNAGASLFTKGQLLELVSSTSGAYFKVSE